MKLSEHYKYEEAKNALVALTKVLFLTGDINIKETRDNLERYLNDTECVLPEIKENQESEDIEESELEELEGITESV